MVEAATALVKPSLDAGFHVQPIVPRNIDEVYRLANGIARAGWAPKSYLINPKDYSQGYSADKIALGIMHGLELDFTPIAALQSIAVINNTPQVWGDGALALVYRSRQLERFKETDIFDASNNLTKCECLVRRRGFPDEIVNDFDLNKARQAKLLGKEGPWQGFTHRMLKMRARAFSLRDGFPDILRGLKLVEEFLTVEELATLSQPAAPIIASPSPAPAQVTGAALRAQAAAALAPPAEDEQPSLLSAMEGPTLAERIAGAKTADELDAIYKAESSKPEGPDEMLSTMLAGRLSEIQGGEQ